MVPVHIEYLGFTSTGDAREYKLRVRQGAESQYVTLAIANEAFLAHRARYQDGPDICFLKVQREIEVLAGALPTGRFEVTDEELAAYRVAHTAKPPQRKAAPAAAEGEEGTGAARDAADRTLPPAPAQGFRSWS
jgi:hypothetical protein